MFFFKNVTSSIHVTHAMLHTVKNVSVPKREGVEVCLRLSLYELWRQSHSPTI